MPKRRKTDRKIPVGGIFGNTKSTLEISFRGEHLELFVPETVISKETIFAGKGTNTLLRKKELLAARIGGRPEEWFHSAGEAWLFDPHDGKIRKAEVHWCEEHTQGIHEMTFKGWLDAADKG